MLAYAIGGVPFGWLFARLVKRVDLRKVGSGSVGATNASRLWPGGWSVAVFITVFVLDFAKGFCAAFFSARLGDWLHASDAAASLGVICGAAAIMGHVFSPYLRFKGGKGVATTLGVVTALAPWSSLAALGMWGLLVGLTRYMSLGSIGAVVALPISYFVSHGEDTFHGRLGIFLFMVGLAGFVIWRHHGNILRLLQGRERKVGAEDQLEAR